MESHDYFKNIKSEKANALVRYRTFTNITKLLQLMEVFVAVALISWSSTRLPLVLKFSGELFAFLPNLVNQHVVFLIGNLIVVACYMLSRYPDSGTHSGGSGSHIDDGNYSYCYFTHRKSTFDAPIAKSTTEIQNPVILNEKSIVKSDKMKQIDRFQRTRSDKMKTVKSHRELRRSVTEMRRNMAVTSGGEDPTVRSVQAVENLSNEEFRIIVETFILKQQRFLKQQSMVEDDS